VLNKSCLWSAQWNYRILALGGVTVVAEMDLDNRIPEVPAVFFSSSSYTTFDHILGGARRGEAAAWMHQLMKDPILRTRLGVKAAEDMARYEAEAKDRSLLKELQAIWDNRSFLPATVEQTAKPRHLQELVADRDRRIGQLESELGWITSKVSYRMVRAAKRFLTMS
jgi:hypothetical protein